MKKQEKTTAVIGLIVIIAVCLMLIAVAVTFIMNNGGIGNNNSEPPDMVAFKYLSDLNNYAVFTDGSKLYIEDVPQSEEGRKLYANLAGRTTAEIVSSEIGKKDATMSVNLTCPNIQNIANDMHTDIDEYLRVKASEARLRSEVYNDDGTYIDALVEEAYQAALEKNAANVRDEMTVNSTLYMTYSSRQWSITNPGTVDNSLDSIAAQLKEAATGNLTVWPITYVIEETALKGSVPDPNGWGITDDPADVVKMLESDTAKRLIGDRKMVWNPDIEFIAGKHIRYYLDETILMIEWQETEAQAVGTFCEVIIADGSQLRRRIAGDAFGDMNFKTTTEFAADTNAVLALGGDFYNHGRSCGIVVYNREIYRFDPTTCDDCYITPDGDMLFSYRNQFSSVEQAQQFIEDNDILYSLCFGPVIIDNGVDVAPDIYPWGEIADNYARSCLGMLGEHHYLTLNMNCELPYHWYLVPLRAAVDAMIKRGCIKAYTLDGGQTATTVVNGELINPVQFGVQKPISDVIYFCSAVPR